MSGQSHYMADIVAKWATNGGVPPASPTTLYLALSTSEPQRDGTGVSEPSGGSYARKAVTPSILVTSEVDGVTFTSDIDIAFTTATGVWGNITHGAVYDAVSAGNMLYSWQWATARNIQVGDTYTLASDDLVFTHK